METFELEHLSFFYPEQEQPALCDVTLSIPQGQFVTLCGRSGCGKTTLLRQLKTALAPHGRTGGRVLFQGQPLERVDLREQSAQIGFVLQSPENQIVTDKVWHELAFGLESLGCDTATIRLRVAEMASFFGIQTWFHREVSQLSGGQKQLLNLAAVMVMQPSVLILDEPTSQLDPIAAADFLGVVGKVNRELGTTILLSEHRLEEAFPLSDRVVVLEAGAILADGPPRAVGAELKRRGHAMFLAMPTPMRVWSAVDSGLDCPVTVREGRKFLADYAAERPLAPLAPQPDRGPDAPPAVELEGVWFRYDRQGPDVVKGLCLSIPAGMLYAVVGGNGTGKTTALSLISGANVPYRGRVRLAGRALDDYAERERFGGLLGVLPQNPQTLFLKKTVELDLWEVLSDRKMPRAEQAARVAAVAALCQLEPLLGRHPYDLSGGEQQRAALAKVLLLEPKILLLDEPTKGLDSQFKQKLAGILKRLQETGTTVVLVSHDVEFCAQYADRCALFFDGAVVSEGPPRTFFSGNSFYTTGANRMARALLPRAVTAEDVIAACGGCAEQTAEPPAPPVPPRDSSVSAPEEDPPPRRRDRLPKRTAVAVAVILLMIPLTLFLGVFYMGNRKYLFVSLLIALETMLPFFLVFEGRRPKARELVVLAALCALAVAGRAAFAFLPQFKPVAAIVILTAVALGGESGFLVGAVTMLVSNLLFGQGSWTPFQMFAMGLIGFLAGVLFHGGRRRERRGALCVYGFLSVFFLYGFVMNTYSLFQMQQQINWGMLLSACAAGAPMDLVHGLATAFFLYVAGPPMLEKLNRIQVKYGLVEPRDPNLPKSRGENRNEEV